MIKTPPPPANEIFEADPAGFVLEGGGLTAILVIPLTIPLVFDDPFDDPYCVQLYTLQLGGEGMLREFSKTAWEQRFLKAWGGLGGLGGRPKGGEVELGILFDDPFDDPPCV